MRFLEEPQGEVTTLMTILCQGQDAPALEKALDLAMTGVKGKGIWQRETGRHLLRVTLRGKIIY